MYRKLNSDFGVTLIGNGNDVSCAGACDGEITITMTGGSVYGYNYFISIDIYPGPIANDFKHQTFLIIYVRGIMM